MTRLSLLALLVLAPLGVAQELVPGKAIEVELKAGDPVLEGHGPSRAFDYDVTFEGKLYVWASSKDFDPILRITDAEGELLGEDNDSGGGSTAFLRVEVTVNELPRITVAAAVAGTSGILRMHVSEVPAGDSADLEIYRTLVSEADTARDAGDYATARARLAEVVEHLLGCPESEQSEPWLGLLHSAAVSAWNAQDLYAANLAFKRTYEVVLAVLPDDHADLQVARMNFANTLHSLGNLAAARDLKEKLVEVLIRTVPDGHPSLEQGRLSLGATLYAVGELADARVLYEKAHAVLVQTVPEGHPDLQIARMGLAATLKSLGDLAGARILEEKLLDVQSHVLSDEHPELQRTQANLAGTLVALGDLQAARALFEKVLEVHSRLLSDEHPDLLSSRNNLATVLGELGDFAGARTVYESVLKVRSRTLPDEHPELQTTRGNLAATMYGLRDFPGARALQENVLEVLSSTLTDDHYDLQTARGNLALTIKAQGDLSGARALQDKVLEVSSRTLPDEHPDLQSARGNLAGTIAAEQAIASEGDGERHREREARRKRCLELIAARCRSQTSATRAALLEASPREAEARFQSLGQSLDYALSLLQGLGVFAPSPELEAPCFVLSETTRGAALASASLIRISASSPRYSELRNELKSQSGVLAALAQRGTTNDEFHKALARRESTERELMALAKELGGGDAPGLVLDIDALAARLGEHDALVAYRRYKNWSVALVENGQTSTSAEPVESTVDSMCAFVLRRGADADDAKTPRALLAFVNLGPIEPIERLVHAWRETLGSGADARGVAAGSAGTAEAANTALASKLRALVFDPLRPGLGEATHLVVVLDDALNLLPIDVLPLADSASAADGRLELVGDRWQIETRCTLTELLAANAIRIGAHALVSLGGADFDGEPLAADAQDSATAEPVAAVGTRVSLLLRGGAWSQGFPSLPHTRFEAREIAALHAEVLGNHTHSIVLEERKASRAALEALAPQARWLHVATHGWFAPESIKSWSDPGPLDAKSGLTWRQGGEEQVKGMSPMLLCGLALAGANLPGNEVGKAPGLVTADEIATLDLTKCELAVLSACDTNVGDCRAGQGVASLQRALQMAGARSVITSLWKVPDAATRELMVDFYRRIWVEKKPKWQALWEAKMKIRNARDEAGKPRYSTQDWAAWVLTGDSN